MDPSSLLWCAACAAAAAAAAAAAEVAVTIGEHAEQQRERVEKLGEKTQQAAAELQALDNKLKLFMKQQNPTHFCCKLLLLLIVLLLCCFVFSTIYARYLKKA